MIVKRETIHLRVCALQYFYQIEEGINMIKSHLAKQVCIIVGNYKKKHTSSFQVVIILKINFNLRL